MESDGEIDCAVIDQIMAAAERTAAATSAAAASSATAASAAASPATASIAAASTLCIVCRAKQLGDQHVPRRKCTCNSGLTVQKDRACDRAKEREQRARTWEDPCGDDLCDLVEPVEPCQHDLASLNDWGKFVRKLGACVRGDAAYAELCELLRSDDFDRLRLIHARSLDARLRWFFGIVCSRGTPEQAREFINVGLKVTDLSTNFDTFGCVCLDDGSLSADPMPRAVQPLYHAASAGNTTMLSWLLEQGADPAVPASDGTTPFYAACAGGHIEIVRILRNLGVDMTTVDQDGTSPALIATAGGHLDVLKALHDFGVDLRAPGHIYEDDYTCLRRNVAPLVIAQEWGETEVAAYLQSVQLKTAKRVRSEESMLERAARAGVADRLKPIPASLLAATGVGSGSPEQIRAAKKQLKALQTANQQIVGRAEKAKLKQTKLV